MSNDQIAQVEAELKKKLTPDPNKGEYNAHTSFTVLYIQSENKYDKIGNGMLQVLKNNLNERYRLLIRDRHDLNKPIYNGYIYPFSDLKTGQSKSTFVFEGINFVDGKVTRGKYSVKFTSSANASQFVNAYQTGLKSNQALFKS